MEPRIQYAKTSDGVRIAYYSIGSGPTLVWTQLVYSNLQIEWQRDAGFRSRAEAVAQRIKFVRYDHRGFGLSDREIDDYSLASFVADLEAVADRLGLRSSGWSPKEKRRARLRSVFPSCTRRESLD
jgi:pimeloyl-ACP methyl ester carboxylesterase